MPDLTLPGQPPPPLFFPPFPNEEKMRRGRLNDEAPLGLLGETHSVGKRKSLSEAVFAGEAYVDFAVALTTPPKSVDLPPHMAGPSAHPYRPDQRPPQPEFFDLDLDLNPDL